MNAALFIYRWKNFLVYSGCLCGWEAQPAVALPLAKRAHAQHLREDCPIGSRRPGA